MTRDPTHALVPVFDASCTSTAALGELDLSSAPQLVEAMQSIVHQGVSHVLVDLTALEDIDPVCISALLLAASILTPQSGQLEVRDASSPTRRRAVLAVERQRGTG